METCTFHTEVVPTGLFAVPRVLIAAVLATMEQDSFAATGLLASALPAQHKGTRTQAQPWSHVFLVSGECGSVSSQQKFEAMDIKALRQTLSQLSDRPVLQLLVTAQFYLENKGKHILEA